MFNELICQNFLVCVPIHNPTRNPFTTQLGTMATTGILGATLGELVERAITDSEAINILQQELCEVKEKLVCNERNHVNIIDEINEKHRCDREKGMMQMEKTHQHALTKLKKDCSDTVDRLNKEQRRAISELQEAHRCSNEHLLNRLQSAKKKISMNVRSLEENNDTLKRTRGRINELDEKVKRSRTNESYGPNALRCLGKQLLQGSDAWERDNQACNGIIDLFGDGNDCPDRFSLAPSPTNTSNEQSRDEQGFCDMSGNTKRIDTEKKSSDLGESEMEDTQDSVPTKRQFTINGKKYAAFYKARGGVPTCFHSRKSRKKIAAIFVTFANDGKRKNWGRWVCGGCPLKDADGKTYHCHWRGVGKGLSWETGKTPTQNSFRIQKV